NVLWEKTSDSSDMVRLEAIAGLAKRKDKRVKEILIRELQNIDEHGSIILESINDFNDFDFVDLLEKQLEINKITQQVNEDWLIMTLRKLKKTAQQ
ncbi:MAG TPA: hypothetical protein PLY70_05685, partial [Saprospiraceae bacterium]|nr:hypothetical protein [Saprospiraceae bacterium]